MADTPAQPPVTTILEVQDDVVVVRVQCTDLSEVHVKALRTDLVAGMTDHKQPFVVDLSKVKFLPSLSIGVLVRIGNEFRSAKQRLILTELQPTLRKVMAITQMDRILEVQDSVDAAMRTLRVGQ